MFVCCLGLIACLFAGGWLFNGVGNNLFVFWWFWVVVWCLRYGVCCAGLRWFGLCVAW